VLLLNGFDHMLPDAHVGAVAEALARRTGARVERSLLDDAVESGDAGLPVVRGELVGARLANLLPGIVVRLLNPTDVPQTAVLRLGFPVRSARAVRLDEEPAEHAVALDGGAVRFDVPPHALRSVLLS
jgi:hypothetical protein